MIKFLYGLSIFFISSFLYAQDSVTIVAVGEAEQEEEKLVFMNPQYLTPITAGEKKVINNLVSILISDFKFYKHLFDVSDGSLKRKGAIPAYKKWKDNSLRYVIDLEVEKKQQGVFVNFSLYDVEKTKIVHQEKSQIDIYKVRKSAHDIAHKIYEKITGKESIFKSKIVFISDRTSTRKDVRKEIYIMDFDGGRKQRLTYSNAMIFSPAISPDNSTLLYSIIEAKWRKGSNGKIQKVKNINLYSYDMKTRKKKIISQLDGINSGAIFTQDGKSIYLTLSHQKNADIFKMNLASKKRTRVTRHFSDDVDPHINAAGDLMTFLSGRSGKAMIYTMDPRSVEKDVKRISYVGRFNAAPRFSPDGKEIVFSSWVDKRFDLYKIDSDGNNLVRLTKNFGSNEEPWFSPDGQFIVFTSQRVISSKKAVQNIYIMNREGEIVRKITDKYGKCYTPRWSN